MSIPSYSDPNRTFHPTAGSNLTESTPSAVDPSEHYPNTTGSGNGSTHDVAYYTHPEQIVHSHPQTIPGVGEHVPVQTTSFSEHREQPIPQQQYQQQQVSPPVVETPTFAPSNAQPHYASTEVSSLPQHSFDHHQQQPQHAVPLAAAAQQSSVVVPGPALQPPSHYTTPVGRGGAAPVSPRTSVESTAARGTFNPHGTTAGQLFPISAFIIKQSGAYSSHLIVNWRTADGRAGQTERLGPSLGLGVAIRSLKNKGIPEGAHVQAYLDVTLGKSCEAKETFIYMEGAPTSAFYITGGTSLSTNKMTLEYGDE